jgi:hypothetical protein
MGIPGPYTVFRTSLAIATWVSLAIGLVVKDVRWMVASGAFGTLWWTADIVVAWVLEPLAQFLGGRFLEGEADSPSVETEHNLENTTRLLEHHIEGNAARHVQIQAALRLADLYRVLDGDEVRSRAVLDLVRSRFPDAEELHHL